MRLQPIEGHSNLVKDIDTGAVLNISSDISIKRAAKLKMKQSEKELLDLREEVQDLKYLLSDLIKRLDGNE